MNKPLLLLLFFASLIIIPGCDNTDPAPNDEIDIPEGYSLFWSDEFNDATINTQNWDFELGDGTDYGLPAGWGNNELQLYTANNENASIVSADGQSVLRITALKGSDNSYSSAKLVTKDLASFRYGIVEVKAKMPEGQGIWPAIWLLGENRNEVDWPGCGEIDIAEVLGNQPEKYYATVHYTNGENKKGETQQEHSLSSGSFSADYHVFGLNWTPEEMIFTLDGTMIKSIPIEADMKEFQRSMYMILNVAVGGYWPGEPDNSTVFPQHMDIDYVRVFTQDGFTPDDPPILDVEEETIGQAIEPNIADNAIKEGFTDLGNLKVIAYGGGGEPLVETSATAIDGDLSLQFAYPGGNWGGAYIEMSEVRDLSQYTMLKFSLHKPAALFDGEIKLESSGVGSAVYLKDYTGLETTDGFVEYTIPMADFTGLDFSDLKIPFAIWNPVDSDGNFVAATVLIDNLHFVN